jgi:thiol-disulfide isomerase/thioredoxin
MSRPTFTLDARKVIAAVVAGAVTILLVVQFMAMVKPAAAREIQAACAGLRPAGSNQALGGLPAAAPNFTAFDHTGAPVTLEDFRGRVVFLNFWATWCNVCKSEKPSLEALARDLGGDDFVVLTLASDPDWDLIREMFPGGSPARILLDPPAGDDTLGPVARAFGIKAVPESFVIDREGKVRHYFINKRDWSSDVVRTCLRAIIDE